jgi:hypothetical protein
MYSGKEEFTYRVLIHIAKLMLVFVGSITGILRKFATSQIWMRR